MNAPIGQQRRRVGAGHPRSSCCRPAGPGIQGTALSLNVGLNDLDLEGELLMDVVEKLDR